VEHLLRLGGIDNTRNSDRGLDLDWIAQVADDQPRIHDLLTTIADLDNHCGSAGTCKFSIQRINELREIAECNEMNPHLFRRYIFC